MDSAISLKGSTVLRKVTLDQTDLAVSQLCLGNYTLGTAQPVGKAMEVLKTEVRV